MNVEGRKISELRAQFILTYVRAERTLGMWLAPLTGVGPPEEDIIRETESGGCRVFPITFLPVAANTNEALHSMFAIMKKCLGGSCSCYETFR